MEWCSEDFHVLGVGPVRVTGTPSLVLLNSLKRQCHYKGIPVEFHGRLAMEGEVASLQEFLHGRVAGPQHLQDHEVKELATYLEEIIGYWLELPESRAMLRANQEMVPNSREGVHLVNRMSEDEALAVIQTIPETVDDMTAAIRTLAERNR